MALVDKQHGLLRRVRDSLGGDGLYRSSQLLEAEQPFEPELDLIRQEVQAIGRELPGEAAMLATYHEIKAEKGLRYSEAVKHLWIGVHRWSA
ncbi:MAG TPA: hypothetical protein VJ890_19620 [Vineibacter sp.]|nr:hypothetical protein [Vineibacter sp.]